MLIAWWINQCFWWQGYFAGIVSTNGQYMDGFFTGRQDGSKK